ncbi:unnamed protein product [Leptosia nina]|uniref:C2H2-type domain-containing protein n=1 Tax=Leptosia nina TaxID=320188 RepID=A0AAV1JDE0_9NEOP
MLHNNNQFQPNDVSMGDTNLTSEQMNPSTHNNLGKASHQMPQPMNPGFSVPEYSYGLNLNSGMSQYPNFQPVPQSITQSLPWQPSGLPINLNMQNGPFSAPFDKKPYQNEATLLNVPQIPQKYKIVIPNNHAQNNEIFFNEQNRPASKNLDENVDKHQTQQLKQYLESNTDLSVRVSSENDVSKSSKPIANCLSQDYLDSEKTTGTASDEPPKQTYTRESDTVKELVEKTNDNTNYDNSFSIRTFKDSDSRKRSLEKTLKMLEISIINSTNTRRQNETDTSKNTEYSRTLVEDIKEIKPNKVEPADIDSEQSPEVPVTKPKPTIRVKDPVPKNVQVERVKIEKVEEEAPCNSVEIKVENLSMEVVNPFQRDPFGLQSEDVFRYHVYDSENSITVAKELIKSGGTSESYFECPYCSLYFNHPKRYLIHIKWHSFGLTNEKRFELQREKEMKKQMKREARTQIKKQIDTTVKEEQEGSNKCSTCQKEFNTYSSLKNHRQKFHPTRSRNCKICGKSVLGWLAMKQHMNTHEESTYNCPDCPKRFKHAHSLAKHRDTHKEKTQACSQCPKKFGSVTLLNIHMKTHERMLRGATFRCTYCGKGYFESFSLAAHERTHRNEKPFTCDICNSSFGTNSSLKRHLKVSHNATKPYECRTCHRCFMQESIRDRHELRLHSDPEDFKFPCKLCSSKFIELKDLKKHLYKVHPKVKRKKNSDSDYSE